MHCRHLNVDLIENCDSMSTNLIMMIPWEGSRDDRVSKIILGVSDDKERRKAACKYEGAGKDFAP